MADNSRRLGGVAWLWIDGVTYPVVGEVNWRVAKVQRATLAGMDGVHGYSETPGAGFISASIRDTANTSVAGFNDMTNVSVTLKLANGKEISGVGMWTVEAQEVSAAEGTLTVRFEGDDVRESTNG